MPNNLSPFLFKCMEVGSVEMGLIYLTELSKNATSYLSHKLSKACFKRRASDVPNALETIDNEAFQLIIDCF